MDLLDKMIDDPQDYDMKLAVPIFFVSHVWCRPSKSLHLSHPDDVQGSKAQALPQPGRLGLVGRQELDLRKRRQF